MAGCTFDFDSRQKVMMVSGTRIKLAAYFLMATQAALSDSIRMVTVTAA